jgi:AcrR family transcriptional regulator
MTGPRNKQVPPILPTDRMGSDGRAITKEDRRGQLLDAAAWLVDEVGLAGFTMEGLAKAAGVSKALPYRHFANAHEALVALMRREVDRLGTAMLAAAGPHTEGDQMIAAALRAYFDVILERGGLLNTLAGPGSPLPDVAAPGGRQPAPFLVSILKDGYGLRGQRATVAAWLVTGLAVAGSDSLARGDANRRLIETLTINAALSTIRSVMH